MLLTKILILYSSNKILILYSSNKILILYSSNKNILLYKILSLPSKKRVISLNTQFQVYKCVVLFFTDPSCVLLPLAITYYNVFTDTIYYVNLLCCLSPMTTQRAFIDALFQYPYYLRVYLIFSILRSRLQNA